jgi:hypothetical protein
MQNSGFDKQRSSGGMALVGLASRLSFLDGHAGRLSHPPCRLKYVTDLVKERTKWVDTGRSIFSFFLPQTLTKIKGFEGLPARPRSGRSRCFVVPSRRNCTFSARTEHGRLDRLAFPVY